MSIVDAADRERIATDLEANLCVEAGAGTGKTTSMVDRVVGILTGGPVNGREVGVDDISVITFTEYAAAELMSRVRERLEDMRDGAGLDQRARVDAALSGLHRAHVETIHAFCLGLLRERPIEAGLDPQFAPMDDLEASVRFDAAYQEWLVDRLAEGGEDLALAIDRGFGLKQIRRLVEAVHEHRAVLPLAPLELGDPDLEQFVANVRRWTGELDSLSSQCTDPNDSALEPIRQAIEWATQLEEVVEVGWDEVVRFLLFTPPTFRTNWGKKDNWGEIAVERQRTLRANIRDTAEATTLGLRARALAGVLAQAEGFAVEYEAQRRAMGLADFDDILLWARRMLRDSPEARDYFRQRFPVLLVDEFQDTDPVQAEIILTLASDDDPSKGWLAQTPRPGGLTVVGDPKQSIYRFRRADITVYEEVRLGPLAGGHAELVQNFRSVPGVIDWVNDAFDTLLVKKDSVQPGNLPLAAYRDPVEPRHLSVTLLRDEVEPDPVADARKAEAEGIAKMVRHVLDDAWPVVDERTKEVRPVEQGDIAILVKAWTDIDVFTAALRRAGVRALTSGGKLFFNRQEVRDLANILASVHDPLDQVALVAALRSQAFACSDEEIVLWRMAGGYLNYRASGPAEPPQRVKDAMVAMKRLSARARQVPLPVLVREVVEHTRLLDVVLAGPGGAQGAANIRRLMEQARLFAANGSGGLREFAAWLARQREEENSGDAPIAERAEDAVLVTTIHASKGLEFSVVLLANLGVARQSRNDPVPDRHANELHVRVLGDRVGNKPAPEFKTPGYDQKARDEEDHADAEDVRLLYVATTRARDHLIVAVPRPPKKNTLERSLLALVHAHLPYEAGTHGEVTDGVHVVDAGALPALSPDPVLDDPDAPQDEVKAALGQRAHWQQHREEVLAEASDALELRRPSDEMERREGADDDALSWGDPLIVNVRSGADVGSALHQVMEEVDLQKAFDLEVLARAACAEAGLLSEGDDDEQRKKNEFVISDVVKMAQACLISAASTRAMAADEAWREVPYMVATDDGFESGRIDLLFREGDTLTVVDWKSDAVGPDKVEERAEFHRHQAECYAAAVQRITKMPVKEVIFVFARAKAEAAITDLPDPKIG
jgi:ATP-dependent helicase/nuclease subunit A